MSRRISCSCGREMDLLDGFAARSIRCPRCGRTVAVSVEEEVEEIEEVEEVEEVKEVEDSTYSFAEHERQDDRAKESPPRKKKPKPKGRCHFCDVLVKGKPYRFIAGFFIGSEVDELYGGQVEEVTTYRNMAGYELYLCLECAEGAWRRKYISEFILWSIPAVLILFFGLVFAASNPNAFWPILGVGALLLLMLAWPLSLCLWRALHPTLDEDVMDEIVRKIAQRDFKHLGDAIWTPGELRKGPPI